jgi:hypothetical protein
MTGGGSGTLSDWTDRKSIDTWPVLPYSTGDATATAGATEASLSPSGRLTRAGALAESVATCTGVRSAYGSSRPCSCIAVAIGWFSVHRSFDTADLIFTTYSHKSFASRDVQEVTEAGGSIKLRVISS